MLSYQSTAEEDFYKGLFVTKSPLELGEFAGEDPADSSEGLIISINRDARLQSLLDSFIIYINTELRQQIPVKDKINLLDEYFRNATEYRLKQQSIKHVHGNFYGLIHKRITKQNIYFMNLLINELENKKVKLLRSLGGKNNKIKPIPHFDLKDKKQATTKQILELHRRLKKGMFIEGTAKQFKSIFELDTFCEPVIWVSEKANELLYFYFKLEDSEIIEKSRNKHEVLKHHLIKKNGLLFDENFKQIYQRIKNGYDTPLRSKEMDFIFNSIFTLGK